jgi:TatD DNase family protein
MVKLVDSHVHLDRYPDEEVVAMVSRGAAVGVQRLLTIGVDLATSRAALRLAGRHPGVLAAVGIHPTRLSTVGGQLSSPLPLPLEGAGAGAVPADFLALLGQEPAAIGEVGLDESAPDLEGQRRFLTACMWLADKRGLPLVLHVVGAPAVHEAALAIVSQHPRVRTVAHYFVGGPDLARRYLESGCWISVGRPVTRPSDVAVREAVSMIPLGRLLLETDTYPLPGRTTEPRDVTAVCAAVAELTGQSYEEIAAATTANFTAFIGQ